MGKEGELNPMKVRKYSFYQIETTTKYPESYADMLRYDFAFIHSLHKSKVLLPHWTSGFRSIITPKRWEAFGYKIVECESFEVTDTDNWYSYLSGLRSVTLGECLAAKKWDELYRR